MSRLGIIERGECKYTNHNEEFVDIVSGETYYYRFCRGTDGTKFYQLILSDTEQPLSIKQKTFNKHFTILQ